MYPLAYERPHYADEVLTRADARWAELGLEPHHKVACFFGNLGARVLDLDTVVEAARLLMNENPDARIVMCGDYGQIDRFRSTSSGLPIVLPGWVDGAQIQTLMRRSIVGLLPYHGRWDFVGSIPNKPIEYLSGGLPVVSGLSGVLEELIAVEHCGLHYAGGDPRALADALLKGSPVIRHWPPTCPRTPRGSSRPASRLISSTPASSRTLRTWRR